MGRMFEALKKADKQKKISPGAAGMFEPRPVLRRKAPEALGLPDRSREEYNQLRQSIISLTPDLKSRSILFVSSAAGEGNPQVFADFGLALAGLGERVVLVDTDLRNPVLHELFGVEKSPGISELLSNKYRLNQVMHDVERYDLRVITGGGSVSNPFPLLDLPTLSGLIDEMKADAEWILFNSPPVSACNDAITLSNKVDGVVLVVQAERTRWEVAQSAKERLQGGNANVLGVVLNDRRMHIPGWIYRRL